MKRIQEMIRVQYRRRGYTDDLLTLALGLCEEAGEVGKAVNAFHNPKYVLSDHSRSDSVEHELLDTLIYLCGIANVLNIDLEESMLKKFEMNRTHKP